MRNRTILALALACVSAACATRPDPRVQAAQDFQRTALELIQRDNEQQTKLNALRLGMSDEEVLRAAGPPTRRQTLEGGGETLREVWIYSGELKALATLTFESGRLVQMRSD